MTTKVQAWGPQDAKIMVVGEAPGKDEVAQGKPFVGMAGQCLREHMLGLGIDPNKVFFTNICKYQPPGNELAKFFESKTGFPNDLVLEGLNELKEEIAAVRPNVIIAAGNYPLWALTRKAHWDSGRDLGKIRGFRGIGDWRGSIIEGVGIAAGQKVVASYHPSAILRKWTWRVFLQMDLERAKQQANFPEIRRPRRILEIDPLGEERMALMDRLLNSREPITFDIEYFTDPPKLHCISFCTEDDRATSIVVRREADIKFIRDILLSGRPLVAQNAMFDCSVLEHHWKIPCLQYLAHDTMLAAHAAYIELPKDLGTLSTWYTEEPCYWTKVSWKNIKLGRQSIEDVYEYNALDALVTHAARKGQEREELIDPQVKKTFDFEMSMLTPLWDMSRKGLLVSKERMATLESQCQTIIKDRGEMLNIIADREFNAFSNAHVSQLLFDRLGLPVIAKTKTGLRKTDDFTLAALHLKSKTTLQKKSLELIREVRKSRSLISKFVDIETDSDGRMRTHYNIAGTTTGRLSSKKYYPTDTGSNQQNIPRDKRVRSVFVPDPGYVFFYNDLERAELVVVAHLSGDPVLLEKINTPGADPHKMTARDLFNKPLDEIDDTERYLGKQTGHAGNYMEGPMTLMKNVNKIAAQTGVAIDAAMAKRLIYGYREIHSGLPQWWRDTKLELYENNRTLYNLLGRKRTFYDRVDATLPTAVAYKPQSTVGDVLNVALHRVWRDSELNELGVQCLVQVHDAIGGQVPISNLDSAMRRMRELMRVDLISPRTGESFYIPVEITVGPSWGECKKWEEDLVAV